VVAADGGADEDVQRTELDRRIHRCEW
jgi:hypothetical protein